MRRVFKYDVCGLREAPDDFVVPMPPSAVVLYADNQRGRCVVWATVSDDDVRNQATENRLFAVVYTGGIARDDERHVSTFSDGCLVFHVFERSER